MVVNCLLVYSHTSCNSTLGEAQPVHAGYLDVEAKLVKAATSNLLLFRESADAKINIELNRFAECYRRSPHHILPIFPGNYNLQI